MATTVETFDFNDRTGKIRPEKYPWHDWFNGQIWLLEHQVDFSGKNPNVFRNTIGSAAKRHNVRTRTSLKDGKYLYLQAISDGDGNPLPDVSEPQPQQ